MIAYKVCKLDILNTRVSCLADSFYQKQYIKGVKVKSDKHSFGIFVFKERRNAVNFVNRLRHEYLTIIKVECFNQKPVPEQVCSFTSFRDIALFYMIKKCKGEYYEGISCPEGTLCFEYVIPLE